MRGNFPLTGTVFSISDTFLATAPTTRHLYHLPNSLIIAAGDRF